MFRRSGKLALFVGLTLLSPPAQAKAYRSFATSSPIGLGFVAGLAPVPKTNFAATPQSVSSSFSHYFAFEPYLDMMNFVLRLSLAYDFYPVSSGRGADSNGNFSDSSAGGSFDYGLRLLLVPWFSHDLKARSFLALSAGKSAARFKTKRTYANSGNAYIENASGTGDMLAVGAGIEFFLVQNYTLQLESGYLKRRIDSFGYQSGNDLTGAPRKDGEPMLDIAGHRKSLRLWGFYFSASLNLNF